MKRVPKDQACYAMSAESEPVLRVAQGEAFCLETEDCYSGNLRTPDDRFPKDLWDTVNPATGPVYVEGAQPGDLLRVHIDEVRTRDYAMMFVEHGVGAVGDHIEGEETSRLPIQEGALFLTDGLSVPIRPMVGVIGTAPVGEAILTGTPGEHGGNMDCKLIAAGASVYLPVNVEGALLAAGDLHAIQGDGEICICAAEVSGEIVMRASAVRGFLPTPCVETDDGVYFIGSARGLDECEEIVLGKAMTYLTRVLGLTPNESARMMSLIGELQVCQVVDPLKTMRFGVPKSLLRAYGMSEGIMGTLNAE